MNKLGKFSFIFTVIVFLPSAADAQHKPGAKLHIRHAKAAIKIDGVLDESDWKEADVAGDFFLNYPVDTARAPFQTEVRLSFDEHQLYIAIVAQDDPSPDLINSLHRDFEYELNDNVGISIGPYNDGINGFYFVITPKGIQGEGTVSNGGATNDSFNIYWDNKWYSVVKRLRDKWIVEMAIPFKSIRYKSNVSEWNIALDRLDKKRNHKSAWIHTPIQYTTGSFAYSGQLVWDDPIPPPHVNISVIPFIAGAGSSDHTADPAVKSTELQTGFDAKIALTPSMNVDLTVNPDFSQVEVDQQVINLTRFEFKFPERRQFFLENNDLFDQAGFPSARAFFSRRIGLVANKQGSYTRVPIAYGARVSGSFNKKWRVNAMNMQTKKDLALGLPQQNYTVSTVQRNFWKQSSISLTYVDKESLHVKDQDSSTYFHESVFQHVHNNGIESLRKDTWNRVVNADLEMLSADNRWYQSSYVSRSSDAFSKNENTSAGTFFQYAGRNLTTAVGSQYIGRNYNAEAGFVPSHLIYPGQLNYNFLTGYRFYFKQAKLVWMGPQWQLNQTYIPGGILTDKNYTLTYSFNFINTSLLQFSGTYVFQRLTSDFSPLSDARYSLFLIGEKYKWKMISGTFQSDTRKKWTYTLSTTYGGLYNGTNFDINGQLNFRYQPYGTVSLRFDFNDLRLPANYGSARLFLIGPRFDVTFTDKVFLTTYVQYNKVQDNINLNARFQWRFKPASDFYIVYTENYLPENLSSKNRSLVFKLTYWLNL